MEYHIKKNVYIYVAESLCFTAEINNTVSQLYFNKKKKSDICKKEKKSHKLLQNNFRDYIWYRAYIQSI